MNKKIIIILAVIVLIGGYAYSKRNNADEVGTVSNGTIIKPEDPSKTGVSTYPDRSINPAPTSVISVKYLIEHRSALNNKVVTVKGIVVVDWTDDSRCRPNISEMLCPQPIIYIADIFSPYEEREVYSDLSLRVVLNEDDKSYKLGQTVQIKGSVISDVGSVMLIKSY